MTGEISLIQKIEEADAVLAGIGDEWRDAGMPDYEALKRVLSGKNYFIVTLCTDGKINRSSIDSKHFVDPCGSKLRLQCPDGCEDFVTDADAAVKVCPHCGKALAPNVIGGGHYVEAGYLKQWMLYTKWLSFSLNKKLVLLELGVGFRYPSVIRFAFERVARLNNKAYLIRVQKAYPQIPEELKDKGIGIAENSVEWLSRLARQI